MGEAQHEELKDIGTVKCPSCEKTIIIKKKTVWNRKESRKKIEEELFAEAIQETF